MAWWQRFWHRWRPRRKPLTLGQRGEAAADCFLQRQGWTVVARGQRDRLGELDLVAVDGRTIVFVEVKTRTSCDYGPPDTAVDREKQRRLSRVALAFLKRHDLLECSARFDVIAVVWPPGARTPLIEHYRDAFEVVGRGQMFA